MLVALSDTHGRESTRLEGRTAEAVDAADLVIHAGDFMTGPVLDAFEARCELCGVYGNNATEPVRERLPAERVVGWQDLRIAVTHGHRKTETALSMFARQSSADLLVFGHSHRPEFREATVPMLNPGSHADPRWNRPAHAELTWDDAAGLAHGRLVEPSGVVFEEFAVEPRAVDAET
jgi:putative phosphoesterase